MTYDLILSSRFQNVENRKREAVRAAHDQDLESLLELLNHYMTLKSARKGETSDETRKLYAVAIGRFLMFCSGTSGARLELTRLTDDDVELWLVQMQSEGMKDRKSVV